jgi:hypothetical protein
MNRTQRINNAREALRVAQAELNAAQAPDEPRYFHVPSNGEIRMYQVNGTVTTTNVRGYDNTGEVPKDFWTADEYLTHTSNPREISKHEYNKRRYLFKNPSKPWYFASINAFYWRADTSDEQQHPMYRGQNTQTPWRPSTVVTLYNLLKDDNVNITTAEVANPDPFPIQFQINSQDELDTLTTRLRVGHSQFWPVAEKLAMPRYLRGRVRGVRYGKDADAETSYDLFDRLDNLRQDILRA